MMPRLKTNNSTKHLDWAAALARLARTQESLDRAENPSPDALAHTYEQRAKRLAQPADSADNLEQAETLMVFRLGEEHYAFPVSEVIEVLRETKLAPVPGAPPSIAGLIQVRGEIRPIYNVRRHLGITQSTTGASGDVILLRGARSPFGVQADAVEEIRHVMKHDRKLEGTSSRVAWMTDDLVRVLNIEMLREMES